MYFLMATDGHPHMTSVHREDSERVMAGFLSGLVGTLVNTMQVNSDRLHEDTK